MGCTCLCARNRDLPHDPDKPKTLPDLPANTLETAPSSPPHSQAVNYAVTLRHENSILRLNPRTSSSFRIISTIYQENDSFSVYSGEFPTSKKRCAIKAIPKRKSLDEVINSGQVLEPLSLLDHPHILQVYDVCQDQESLFVISEPVVGTLHQFMNSHGPGEESWVQGVMQQVLGAVTYCHRMNMILVNLNPDNIGFKESDGGDVRLLGCESWLLKLKNSPEFHVFEAPEVESEVFSEKADIWSCGVLLYYLLSGETPALTPAKGGRSRGSILFKGFSFDPEVWGGVNCEAISLILAMAGWKADDRPSASECLQSPWVQRSPQHPLPPLAMRSLISNLAVLDEGTSLKTAILRFIINRVAEDSELRQLSLIFDSLDSDKDGLISETELAQSMKDDGEVQREAARKIVQKVDRNGNGMIDFSEFLLAAFEETKLLSKSRLKKAFRLLDRDGNGRISLSELKIAFCIKESEGDDKAWSKVISESDLGKDGEITYEEFERFLRKPMEKHSKMRK